MADEITDGIDRVFGALDRAFDSVGALFGRAEETGRKAEKARSSVQRARAERAAKAGVVKRAPFRIEEVTDAETSEISWLVTNGTDKVECSTETLAKTLLATLEGGR